MTMDIVYIFSLLTNDTRQRYFRITPTNVKFLSSSKDRYIVVHLLYTYTVYMHYDTYKIIYTCTTHFSYIRVRNDCD